MAGCTHCHVAETTETFARDRLFRRALWIALALNAAMFGAELISSLIGRSVSLQADALDFLGDAWSYGVTLVVLGMGLRARSTAALAKGATMGLFGLWVMTSAVDRALAGNVPTVELMGPVALLALFVNVAVALLLFRYRGGDANTRSIWLCSRNDAIGNLAVLGAAGVVFAIDAGWPDVLVAVCIATLSLTSAASIFRQAYGELVHRSHGTAAP